jgi:hypothetical protein
MADVIGSTLPAAENPVAFHFELAASVTDVGKTSKKGAVFPPEEH